MLNMGKNQFLKKKWIGGLVWKKVEPIQFQSNVKIGLVTQSNPGLVGLIGLINPTWIGYSHAAHMCLRLELAQKSKKYIC